MSQDYTAQGLAATALRAVRLRNSGAIFGCLGDSISEYNTLVSGTETDYNAIGYLSQAMAYLRGRGRFPITNNFGISGQKSSQILARVGQVIASNTTICTVMAGTNDAAVTSTTPLTKEQTWSNLKAIYDALMQAGIMVVALPISARGLGTVNGWSDLNGNAAAISAARSGYYWVNRKVREYAAIQRLGCLVVADTDKAWLDPANGTGDPLAPATTDYIHPGNFGGDLLGKAIFDVLDPLLPNMNLGFYSRADVYDATNNPLGSRMNTTGMFLGTTGTVGAGCTGTLALGWSASRSAGSTLTAALSQIAVPTLPGGGGQKQVITLGRSGVGAAGEQLLLNIVVSGTFSAGEALSFMVDTTVAGLVNVQNIATFIETSNGPTHRAYGLKGNGAGSNRIVSDWSKLIQTPYMPIGSGTTSVSLRILIDVDCSQVADPAGIITLNWAGLVS